ncbi:MAG: TfoX/Sxy family protein [Chloroflexi bacterium]|nr:TfoX/Sxy family protein [Chloroflexota bacterium]
MAKEYVEKLSELMSRATAGKFKNVDLECKHFFSGAAIYANGRICITLTSVGLAVKLPEKSRNALMRHNGTKQLRYFPKGPVKKDYIVLPEAMINDIETLRHWVEVSIEYVTGPPTTGAVSN